MIKLIIPTDFSEEFSYTWSCLLSDFLGLEFDIVLDPTINDSFLCVNEERVVIRNYFFQGETINDIYSIGSLPSNIIIDAILIGKQKFDIVSLFGSCDFQDGILDSDIVSSTFFMLTRWEEYVFDNVDMHTRFSAHTSTAYKFDFLHRPIVNEYVEVVWALLKHMGFTGKRKERTYKIVPTHDIDHPYLWSSTASIFRSLAFSIVKRPSIHDFVVKIKALFGKYDIYNSYGKFIRLANESNTTAYFNFMSGGENINDPSYDIRSRRLTDIIETILESGHEIGFHPSYDSYNNSSVFNSELENLEQVVRRKISNGRQHYLRFDISSTWSIWDDSGISWDSTMGYADEIGFRCGVCYPFPVFDITRRKRLDLIQKPLLVMDVTLAEYKKYDTTTALKKVSHVKNEVQKYNGEFVFLWHNSSFYINGWSKYEVVLNSMYFK